MWWDEDFSLDDDNVKTYSLKEMVRGVYPFIKPHNRTFIFALIGLITLHSLQGVAGEKSAFMIPVLSETRSSVEELNLTEIGEFGLLRIPRPGIPAHLHTGIDIRRPGKNYENEPIFPIYTGEVISIRDDGPFAQIILSHEVPGEEPFWTVYEHIAGIQIDLNDSVHTGSQIARFMNLEELTTWGWQFDHFHLEILKQEPIKLEASERHPRRLFTTFALTCYSEAELNRRYSDPIHIFLLKLSQ